MCQLFHCWIIEQFGPEPFIPDCLNIGDGLTSGPKLFSVYWMVYPLNQNHLYRIVYPLDRTIFAGGQEPFLLVDQNHFY